MITIELIYEELDALITELEQPAVRPYDATIAEIVDQLEQKKRQSIPDQQDGKWEKKIAAQEVSHE